MIGIFITYTYHWVGCQNNFKMRHLSLGLFGLLIRQVFYRYSNSMSSRRGFGNTLLMVTISTASLIAVVKSSLALSLGLVGALSVVRFRTAVKEPYNLAFILFSIFCSHLPIFLIGIIY